MQSSPKKQSQVPTFPTFLTVEIVPNKLTWIIADKPPQQKQPLICFNTERLNHKISEGLSIKDLKQFLDFITELFQRHSKISYFTKNDQTNMLIGSVIVSLYKVIALNQNKNDVEKFISSLNLNLKQFGDANLVSYGIRTVINCINIVKGYGFLNRKISLDLEIKTKEGTIYRLIPQKMFVFQYVKPHVQTHQKQKNKSLLEFTKKLKHMSITKVIGFQSDYDFPYNPNQFSLNGIMHQMITIFDPTQPDIVCIEKAISAIKPEDVYAINSQDEFGLSMFFVAAYAIKILKYSLQEAVCWCRMMVPNCIKQSQLVWLKKKYKALAGIQTYVTAQEALKHIKKNGVIVTTDTYS